MRFKLFKWEVEINCGFSYWGNEPTPLRASWSFGIDIDLHNEAKQQYNYDLTKILTEEMEGCWVCLGPLNRSVLGYDRDLMALSDRLEEQGLSGTYMRYGSLSRGSLDTRLEGVL